MLIAQPHIAVPRPRLPTAAVCQMSIRFPELIAFDLDYTLWDLWIDTHATGPLHRNETTNQVLDRYNRPIELYKDAPEILRRIRKAGVPIAACSRTSAPELAREALNLLLIPSQSDDDSVQQPAIEFFDRLEIYPGSKLAHFKQIHKTTGIPYSQMLFFDDEPRNKEVEKLGVTFFLVTDGIDHSSFDKGLAEWAERHPENEVAARVHRK